MKVRRDFRGRGLGWVEDFFLFCFVFKKFIVIDCKCLRNFERRVVWFRDGFEERY